MLSLILRLVSNARCLAFRIQNANKRAEATAHKEFRRRRARSCVNIFEARASPHVAYERCVRASVAIRAENCGTKRARLAAAAAAASNYARKTRA